MTEEQPDAFSDEIARVRASRALGRSQALARLFDYLAAPANRGRALTEADVAHEVFGRALDLSGDASVRVYIHRLRKKLEAFYQGAETRLLVPLGQYRLALEVAAPAPTVTKAARPGWIWAAAMVGAALLSLNLGAWWLFGGARDTDGALARAAASPLWAGLGRDRPVIVVVGDYYIFGDTEHGEAPVRMIRAFEINSPADLDAWLMDNPAWQGRYIDLDTWYTPVGATQALRDVMPLVRRAAGSSARVRVMTASRVTPDLLKTADIVYVGYFSGLRILQQPVFERSGYAIGATYDELVDRQTGQSFTSSAGPSSGDRANRDYGYLATFRGVAGNRFLIIAGARDIGVIQAAEIAADPHALPGLRGGGAAIEALYEVDGVGRINVGVRPVKVVP